MLDYIQPATLIEWVENTAPFLFAVPGEAAPGRLAGLEFQAILRKVQLGHRWPDDLAEYVEDFFALCLAAHHGTVATYIPTDVDSKIRGLLWKDHPDPEGHERMFECALGAMKWPLSGVSARYSELAGLGPVSGHNGEQLSVLMGALQTFLKQGRTEWAERARTAIREELRREAIEFQTARESKDRELDSLRLAAWLTHNVGDIDQGLSYWPKGPEFDGPRQEFGRLAHENTRPFGGVFAEAARLYKRIMAPEGHRNYPLRAIKALRQTPDLLLPQAPFLDEWGATVAQHGSLSDDDRAEVLGSLVTGSRKLAGQRGYFRAIRGMLDVLGEAGMQSLLRRQPNRVRKEYEAPDMRKMVAVSRESFESSLKKAMRAA